MLADSEFTFDMGKCMLTPAHLWGRLWLWAGLWPGPRAVSSRGDGLLEITALASAIVGLGLVGEGCVTVTATHRQVLADPIMQFEGDPQASAQVRHAIDNREGSYGGGGV